MARTDKSKVNIFKSAVDKCVEIRGKLCAGLSAMHRDSVLVTVRDTRLLDGSVDIDNAVKAVRPNEPRWDYVIGYGGEAFFAEVHPADTRNVDEMVNKVMWLKDWLSSVAPDLKLLHRNGVFHWIPSGRVKILKTSSQYKKIAVNKLSIANPLMLK